MTEETQLQPLPDGVLDKLRQVSTSTIATQLYKRGFRQPQLLGVRPISQVTDGFVAEAFTGTPGKYVPLSETVRGFREIVEGKHDDVPESAFFLKGAIDEVVEAAAGAAA